MADAYGSIVFQKSQDCQFEQTKLCSILNKFSWTADTDGGWEPAQDGNIVLLESMNSMYPTLFPFEITKYIFNNSDNILIKYPSEMSESDFDSYDDVELDHINFENFVNDVSNCLSSGFIMFSMACNEKLRYIQIQKLIIHSNGSAKRSSEKLGPWSDFSIEEEYVGNYYKDKRV